MNDKERKSCIDTIELLRRLAFNVHGVMDVIDNQNCDKIIEMLNKPETRWIPCSKQLPEVDDVYLVYAPSYTGGSSSAKECHNGVMFSKFKNKKWSIEHGYHKRPNCVRAWMPLPEPYLEVEE